MEISQAPAATERGPRDQRLGPSLLGGAVALALALLVVLILDLATSSDGHPSALGEQPVFLGICLAVSATLGWRLGPMAASGGWGVALGSGLIVGICWPPITMLVSFGALIIDGVLRGIVQLNGAPATLGYLLYDIVLFWIIGAVALIPLGAIWGLGTRAAGQVAERRWGWARGGERASTAALILAFIAASALGGAATTLTYSPWATRCLDLPGGAPSAAAFSPAGNLLAVTTRRDSTTPGTVFLLEWPSGRLLGQWAAWVDRAVAVAPDGQVYWSSADYASGTNGIVTAGAGSQPTWFTAPNGGGLADMTWTTSGLRGVGTTIDELGFLPFASDHAAVINDESSDNLGAFWISSDGTASARSTFWPGESVEVRTPTGTVSISTDSVQSIALTADNRRLIAAEADGGLDVIEIASGRSHRLMPGSQEFVALSQRGDIAWLNDEPFGPGRLCTSTLAQLGAG